MSVMTEGAGSDTYTALMERLWADYEWLAERGIRLSQLGPDPVSGKVHVYLEHYSDDARQLLVQRYGPGIVSGFGFSAAGLKTTEADSRT